MSRGLATGGRDRRGHHQRTPWARRRRRLITIALLILCLLAPGILWRARLAGEVRGQLAAYTARGLPVTLAALNQRLPDPPAEENAAVLYLDAYRTFRPPDDSVALRAETPSLENVEAMAHLVATNGEALALLYRAAALEEARYIGTYNPGPLTDVDHLQPLKTMSLLLRSQVVTATERGMPDEVSAGLRVMVALAHSLAHDGLYVSLLYQWELERQIQDTLQWVLPRVAMDVSELIDLERFFAAKRRDDAIRHMLETEQCLFVARIREGTRRNGIRTLLMASGVGDLNLRASLSLGDIALTWPTVPYAERMEVETRYATKFRAEVDRRILLATLRGNGLPASWTFFRDQLDEARVAHIGLAVYRYRRVHGVYPETLAALVPDYLAASDLVLTTGKPAEWVVTEGGVEVNSGTAEKDRLFFRLPRD